MKILIELLKSVKESNARLDEIEELLFKTKAITNSRDGAEADIAVPINEEIYQEICKELGLDSLLFMGIA